MRRKTALTLLSLCCIVYSFAQTANFSANSVSGCSPLVVNFQDQSSGNITSWYWEFGNGGTSTLQHPSATYFTPGTYTVKLTVTGPGGSHATTKTGYITVYGKPTVDFTVDNNTGCYPKKIQFTNLSTPSAGTSNTTYLWDFGDGTQSTEEHPQHIYTSAGNFTVTLKITNDKGCSATLPRSAFIQINGGIEPGFTSSQPNVCRPPFNISFNNTSTGPGSLSWYWDFGDGNTSTAQHPVHSYTSAGNYTVSLAVTSTTGCTDTMSVDSFLVIQNIQSAFTVPDSVCVNSVVHLTNSSSPAPLSYQWDFGDGSSDTSLNPVKIWSSPGTYSILLTNEYDFCTDTLTKSIKVLPRPVASFTVSDTFKCEPSLTVNFTDASQNAVAWQWSFGDGGSSNQQNPSHTYNSYGEYDVQLIVTNASGCTDTLVRTRQVVVKRPVITFPNLPYKGCIPFTLIPMADIETGDQVTSWFWDFGDGSTSNQQNTFHTYPVQGTFALTLTITTSTGCTETYSLPNAIKVGRKPVVNFSGGPTPVCAFQSVQFTDLTNEADEWIWDFGDGSTSNQQNPSHQFQDTGWFDIKLIAINNGCKDSLTIDNMIHVKPPIARFGFQTTCQNRLQFSFLDSSINASTWLWNFGDGNTSTLQNPVHVFPAYGNYTVSLTVSNDTCSHTYTRNISVINESPDFFADFTTACKGTTFHLNGVVSNPNNISLYSWYFGEGDTLHMTTAYGPHYYNQSGYYDVTLITTDIYGCKDTTIKDNYIRVNGAEADFIAANPQGCKGMTVTFNDLSVSDGLNNIVNWQWDFGDGSIQNHNIGGNVQHTYANSGTFTVKLTITDAAGCTDSLRRVNLVRTSEPKAMFVADTLSCPGATVYFGNTSVATNNAYSSYWEFGDGGTSTIRQATHQYPSNGYYTVKLVITDQFGCKDSLIRPNYIRVDSPSASFTMNDSISSCTPFEVQFTNTSSYYYTYLWHLGGGTSNQFNPIQFYTIPGVYNVSLVAVAKGGCMDTAYATVTVYDTAGAHISYTPLDGCKPLPVSFSAYSPGPMDLYTWDFGDGILITDTATTIQHVYNSFGNFTPKVILTDPAGCIIPVEGIDTIRIKGATAKFGLDRGLFCDSGWISITDSTLYNDSLVSYHWDFGDGNTSNIQQPVHQYTSPGLYTITLNVQTEFACVDTFQIVDAVKVVASPLISIGGDSVICLHDYISHLGVFERADTSMVQWQWTFPDGSGSGMQYPDSLQYNSTGSFVVNAIATNSSGCADTTTRNILVNPLPMANLPASLTMQSGFPVTINGTYSQNVVNWNWTPPATLDCQSCPNPTASPKFNTKYLVNFTDSNGCVNTATVEVIVICKNANVFVPNTFSPNNDGSNDVFYVRGKGLDRVKSIRVFNRWGEVVFEQQNFPVNDASYGWNGMYKGKKATPDVYVYQVEVFCENSQIIRFEGNVALIQ